MNDWCLPTNLRYRVLDVLRAFASLSVVVWHYQHFYFDPTMNRVNIEAQEQPFFWALGLFYRRGALAVDLFFVLSGFIFFTMYSKRIAEKAIGGSEFAALRFSRLYPLHFITLVLVL